MLTFALVAVGSGVLFATLDVIINANPLGRSLYEVYRPLARDRVNPLLGLAVDLVFGVAMAGIYVVLHDSLPGSSGVVKGLSYAVLMSFFRVVMSVVSQGMTLRIPGKTLVYTLLTGIGESGVIGVLYGLTLEPWW